MVGSTVEFPPKNRTKKEVPTQKLTGRKFLITVKNMMETVGFASKNTT